MFFLEADETFMSPRPPRWHTKRGRRVSGPVIDDQLAVCFDSLHVEAERRRKNCLPVRPSLPATLLQRDILLSLFFVTNCALRFLSHLRRQLNLKCNLVLNGLFRVVFTQEAKSEDVTMATDYSLLFPSLCLTDLTRSSYHHRQPGDQRTAGRLASRRGRQIRTRLYFYSFVVLFFPLYFLFSSVVLFFFPKILFLLSLSLHSRSFLSFQIFSVAFSFFFFLLYSFLVWS